MNTDPYEVIDDHTIRVCAWCFPGNKIFDLFPDLFGNNVSHGICPAHARRQIETKYETNAEFLTRHAP